MSKTCVFSADPREPAARRARRGSVAALLLATTCLVPTFALAQGSASDDEIDQLIQIAQLQPIPQPGLPGAPLQPGPQAPPQITPLQGDLIERIQVRGNERIETSTVLAYLPVQPGQRVTDAQLDAAVDALAQTGLFANVDMGIQGTDLIVQVVENPIINRVLFEGNSSIKTERLRDEVSVRPRGIFTRARVQQDVQRMIEIYRRAGRISATITPKFVPLPQSRVDLVFEIDEGPNTGILDVNFLGNESFSDNDLRDVVRTERSVWWRFFSADDNYDPDRLELDKDQLTEYYRNRGFYDFRVVSAVAELAPDKNGFAVSYTVDEGPEYRFGNLDVKTTMSRLDSNVLRQLLPIRSGQVYQDEAIDQAVDRLTFAAGAAGFAFVNIVPNYTPNRETQTVDVTFQVEEGPRVYVERVNIVGNTVTMDPVIRREMLLSEGDAYNAARVQDSRTRIQQLDFFKSVEIQNEPGSAPDKTNLLVTVEEQPTGELAFTAGYSSIDKLVVDLTVSQRNFAGRGQNVRARVQTGSIRQQIDFSFTEPRFRGRNLIAGFDLYSYKYDFREQAGYQSTITGGNVRMGFPLSQNSSLGLRYVLRSDDLSSSFCGPGDVSALCSSLGAQITSAAGYTWVMDRRDNPVRPTRGYVTQVRQDIAGFGGETKYVRSEVEAAWHYGFTPSWVLTVNGEAGYIDGYGGEEIRINDRFFKGGNTFRGFETAGIGPRQVTTREVCDPVNPADCTSEIVGLDALGGKLFAIGSMELSFPTPLPEQFGIRGALFTEFGTVGQLDDRDLTSCVGNPPTCGINPSVRDDSSLRASAGISIFWRGSPLGPMRFDFSKVLAKEDYDKTESFRFSQTTRF